MLPTGVWRPREECGGAGGKGAHATGVALPARSEGRATDSLHAPEMTLAKATTNGQVKSSTCGEQIAAHNSRLVWVPVTFL